MFFVPLYRWRHGGSQRSVLELAGVNFMVTKASPHSKRWQKYFKTFYIYCVLHVLIF